MTHIPAFYRKEKAHPGSNGATTTTEPEHIRCEVYQKVLRLSGIDTHEPLSIALFDIKGRMWLGRAHYASHPIDMSAFPSGSYILHLQSRSGYYTFQVSLC